jgi:hypothetical protein
MSSQQQNIQIETRTMAVTLERTALDVAVSVEIEAESRRVLYALTIPEYMEAWLQMPDTEKLQCYSTGQRRRSRTCGTIPGLFHTSPGHLASPSSPRCSDSLRQSESTARRIAPPLRLGNGADGICSHVFSPRQLLTHP